MQRKPMPPRTKPMSRTRVKSTAARKAAKGKPCLMNVACVCNYNADTTVLIHLRWLGDCGMGCKPTDAQGVYGCSACNTWTDSPTPQQARDRLQYEADRNFYAARALVRMRLIDQREAA